MDKAIKSRIKRLEKIDIEGIEKPKEEKSVYFQINNASKMGTVVLTAENLSKSFDNKILFDKSSFYVKHGEKVGIYGCNGCGKSTLIKCILNECNYDGKLYISENRKVGYISQDVDGLDINKSIIDLFMWNNRKEQGEIRTKLNLIGFSNDRLDDKVECLSLGERMKLKILLMLQKICNKILVFENKHIKRYEYTFDQYINHIKEYDNTLKNNSDKSLEEKMIIENRLSEIIVIQCESYLSISIISNL